MYNILVDLLGYLSSIYIGGALITFVIFNIYTCFEHGINITSTRITLVTFFTIGWPYFAYLILRDLIRDSKKILYIYAAGIATPFIVEYIAYLNNITARFIVESIACGCDYITKYIVVSLASVGIIALGVLGYVFYLSLFR